MMTADLTIAISADFFKAFTALPGSVQTRAIALVNKFRENPLSPGLHYEKLHTKDKKLYSLRVNDDYRCIVMRTEKNNVFVMLWIDKHDDAYAWAEKRACSIDPKTGSLQVLVTTEQEVPESTAPSWNFSKENPPCWLDLSEAQLIQIGVPADLVTKVRQTPGSALASLKEYLPELAWEALNFLNSGDSYDDVLDFVNSCSITEKSDPEDFAAALNTPFSLSHFMVNPGEEELESILQAPLEQWRVFLHPTQRSLVERDWNGPVRVLGGAGTGKTVVAMHRARWLARKYKDGGKILFTTFSKTLAEDLRQHMRILCNEEELERIEIVNLDKWVFHYLSRENFHYTPCLQETSNEIWKSVIPSDSEFPASFYKDEWNYIIQPQEIMDFSQYAKASRAGRGKAISRGDRKKIWPVFEDFRLLLQTRKLLQPNDAMREARLRIMLNGKPLYRSVIVDETQDMSAQALRLIRALVPEEKNDIFLVGDGHQRIYGHPVSLKSCGIFITGRGKKLSINYRTTEEIRRLALSYLHDIEVDDMNGGLDSNKNYISLMHGDAPIVQKSSTQEEEITFIINTILELNKLGIDNKDICIVVPGKKECEDYRQFLESQKINTYILSNDRAEDRNSKGVRISTMHRVKGLEFKAVFLISYTKLPYSEDPAIQEELKKKEQALQYVAATRARQFLFVCKQEES